MVQNGISIVIPTKNRLNDLKRCLDSLILQLSAEDEIIVIENGSSDGTSDYLRLLSENFKNIKYIYDSTPNLS
ncbi:MAG: glycosyltransferase family 2 protein [Thermoplasmata archaeon]